MTLEVRTFTLDLETREDGRTLYGMAIPWDTPAQIGGFVETWKRGAFEGTDPARVPLLRVHDHESLPIGRAVSLTDTERGLETELRISKTQAGDEVLELIRDGALRGLSVGFKPIQDRWDNLKTRVERVKAKLVELSLTAFPAFEQAQIVAVREEEFVREEPLVRPRLTIARLRL